jgi:hypothetical protein
MPNPHRVHELIFIDVSGDEEEANQWNPEYEAVAHMELLFRCENEECFTYRMKCSKPDVLTTINRILSFWKEGTLYDSSARNGLYVVPFTTDAAVHRRIISTLPPPSEQF